MILINPFIGSRLVVYLDQYHGAF